MLTQYNLDEATMLKRSNNMNIIRYNAVCHLVTAADGAAQFYNLNHEARHESPELVNYFVMITGNCCWQKNSRGMD